MEVFHSSKSTIIFFEKTEPSPFYFLPDDLLRHIFSFLNSKDKKSWNVVLADRKWCVLGRDVLDPSVDGNFLLLAAVNAGKIERSLWLLSDARVNLTKSSPMDNEIWVPLKTESDSDISDEEDSVEEQQEILTIGQQKKRNFLEAAGLACKSGYVRIVEKFLSVGLDPNEKIDDDETLLEIAARKGRIDIIRLLDKDPRLDIHVNHDMAFVLACQKGRLELVNEWLSSGKIDPSARPDNAPLVVSMEAKTSQVALRLLEDSRIDPCKENNLAIARAVKSRKLDVVKKLMEDPRVKISADFLICVISDLHSASAFISVPFDKPKIYQEGDEQIILELLKDEKFEISQNEVDQIFLAFIHLMHMKVFEVLFKDKKIYERMNLNKVLQVAIYRKRLDLVELLLKDPLCDPSSENNNAIFLALKFMPELVSILLKDERVMKTVDYCSIMNNACRLGHFETVEAILKDQKSVLLDPNNESLEQASIGGYQNIIELLLKNHSDMSQLHNALVRASEKGYFALIKALLQDTRIDPSANGNQALIIAAKNMHIHAFNELLKDPRVKALALKQSEARSAKRKLEETSGKQ